MNITHNLDIEIPHLHEQFIAKANQILSQFIQLATNANSYGCR